MPVLNQRPKPPKRPETVEQPPHPVTTKPEYKSNVVDTKYEPQESLVTHIEGSPWIVTYYQQIIGENQELSSQELDKNPVYQQYVEIENLELKVDGALSGSQRSESLSMEYGGNAYVYPPVIPNTGDMFLADIGDGREGVFAITATERLSIFKESCFSITYVLRNISTQERRDDLKAKSVKHQHFVKRFLQHGKNPLVVDSEYKNYLSLEGHWHQLISYYFSRYYDHEIASLKVPGQTYTTYDPFMVSFLKAFIEGTEHPHVWKMKRYAVDIAGYRKPKSLWDLLLHPHENHLDTLQQKLALVDSTYFGIVPQYESVYFSSVKDVVFPVDGEYDQLCHSDFLSGTANARDIRFQFKETKLGRLSELSTQNKEKDAGVKLYQPVTKDDYYVFSKYFYRRETEHCTVLEQLVLNYIDGEPIDKEQLAELSENAKRWMPLDGFYYIPVLLLLLKVSIRGN